MSFHSEDEINTIRSVGGKDPLIRSNLGLVKQREDWIFSLNIGNVMQMSLLSIDEIANNGGVKLEAYHEVARDSMLEKIVLICVSYFCIATEMRFLAKQSHASKKEEGSFSSSPFYKDSEAYHAKAVHLAA